MVYITFLYKLKLRNIGIKSSFNLMKKMNKNINDISDFRKLAMVFIRLSCCNYLKKK